MTPDEEKVVEANKNFYRALQALDLEEMESVWLQEDWVRCLHPGWDMLEGWEAVRESWQQIFEGTKFLRVSVGVQWTRVEKEIAWVCCTERISSAAEGRFETAYVQSTNLYMLRGGSWRLILHHASHLPAPLNKAGADLVQ
jgi:ketosteroid isomerase-like protein